MKTAHDLVAEARNLISEIPLSDAEQAIANADLLIDVREADEYHTGHVPGAINIPRGLLEFALSNDPSLEDRSLKVVLYCKTSGRAALSAKAMHDMGYLHVQSIAGGIDSWKAQGKRTVTPQTPDFD